MLNSYFNNFGAQNEQALYEGLVIESIRQYGHEIYYLPREIVNEDILYGEDTLSKFDKFTSIEGYIKSVDSFEGERNFLI